MDRENCTHISLYAGFVYDLINIIGCHTRLDCAGSNIQHLPCKPADFPHSLLFLRIKNGDIMSADELLFRSWDAITCVVGMGNRRRNRSSRGERVDRPERPSKLERGERVVEARRWIWFRNHLWRK